MKTLEAEADLLGLIGVASRSSAPSVVITRIRNDLNTVLQKLWTMALPWWKAETKSLYFASPASVSGVGATKGSKSLIGTFSSSAVGCRVEFGSYSNRIAKIGSGTAELVFPYMGNTGTVTAKVFYDCKEMGATEMSVMPPVFWDDRFEIVGVRGKLDLKKFEGIGIPKVYLVEPVGNKFMIRVSPSPNEEGFLSYEARLKAVSFDSVAYEANTEIPVPMEYAESVLLPLLRMQFSTWKHFEASGMGLDLKDQYSEAWQILSKLRPQSNSVGFVKPAPLA